MKIPTMVAMMPGFAEMLANVKEVKRTANVLTACIDDLRANHAPNATVTLATVFVANTQFKAALARLPEMPEI